MLKKLFISMLGIFCLLFLIALSPNDEKPKVTIKVLGKEIPYTISDYKWGKFIHNVHHAGGDGFGKELKGVKASPGIYVDIHFSIKPERVEIIEHTANNKSLYEKFEEDGYSFQVDTIYGERIFEVKGYWKNGQYISYLIKVNIVKNQ